MSFFSNVYEKPTGVTPIFGPKILCGLIIIKGNPENSHKYSPQIFESMYESLLFLKKL